MSCTWGKILESSPYDRHFQKKFERYAFNESIRKSICKLLKKSYAGDRLRES